MFLSSCQPIPACGNGSDDECYRPLSDAASDGTIERFVELVSSTHAGAFGRALDHSGEHPLWACTRCNVLHFGDVTALSHMGRCPMNGDPQSMSESERECFDGALRSNASLRCLLVGRSATRAAYDLDSNNSWSEEVVFNRQTQQFQRVIDCTCTANGGGCDCLRRAAAMKRKQQQGKSGAAVTPQPPAHTLVQSMPLDLANSAIGVAMRYERGADAGSDSEYDVFGNDSSDYSVIIDADMSSRRFASSKWQTARAYSLACNAACNVASIALMCQQELMRHAADAAPSTPAPASGNLKKKAAVSSTNKQPTSMAREVADAVASVLAKSALGGLERATIETSLRLLTSFSMFNMFTYQPRLFNMTPYSLGLYWKQLSVDERYALVMGTRLDVMNICGTRGELLSLLYEHARNHGGGASSSAHKQAWRSVVSLRLEMPTHMAQSMAECEFPWFAVNYNCLSLDLDALNGELERRERASLDDFFTSASGALSTLVSFSYWRALMLQAVCMRLEVSMMFRATSLLDHHAIPQVAVPLYYAEERVKHVIKSKSSASYSMPTSFEDSLLTHAMCVPDTCRIWSMIMSVRAVTAPDTTRYTLCTAVRYLRGDYLPKVPPFSAAAAAAAKTTPPPSSLCNKDCYGSTADVDSDDDIVSNSSTSASGSAPAAAAATATTQASGAARRRKRRTAKKTPAAAPAATTATTTPTSGEERSSSDNSSSPPSSLSSSPPLSERDARQSTIIAAAAATSKPLPPIDLSQRSATTWLDDLLESAQPHLCIVCAKADYGAAMQPCGCVYACAKCARKETVCRHCRSAVKSVANVQIV